MQLNLPDLAQYGGGGLSLLVAVYIVLQSLKRRHTYLARWMPEITLGLSAALVAALMWAPRVFALLAGTIVTAAIIFSAHGTMKNVAKPPEGGP